MSRVARHELLLGRYISMQQSINAISRVTIDDIRDVARKVIDEDLMSIATLGPSDLSDLENSL